MINRTYRRLDEPPQLGPFSIGQWAVLVLIAGAVYGITALLGLTGQAAFCVGTVLLSGPAVLMWLSEGSRPSYLKQTRDAFRWAFSAKTYTTGGGDPQPFTLKVKAEDRRLALNPGNNNLELPE